jgi:hypothetical protein
VDKIKEAIYKYGPVWTTITAGINFRAYRSGVLDKSDEGVVNHAVVICGWNDATNSWILRNSWGYTWGENGYARIKYGICSIGSNTAALVYKGEFSNVDPFRRDNNIEIYPNPSLNGLFTVNGLEREDVIEVYDVLGKLINRTVAPAAVSIVDISERESGLYLYKIISAGQLIRQGKVAR